MSQGIEIPKMWSIFETTEIGIPVKKALGKLEILPRSQDLLFLRKHGLELLPLGSGAGLHGDEREKAFFEIYLNQNSSSDHLNIARILFKRMSLEDGHVRSVVLEAENTEDRIVWRKVNFRANGRISALTIELSNSGKIENMRGSIIKDRRGAVTTFLATNNWQRPVAKNLDHIYYGSNGVVDGLEFIRSCLDFSYGDMPAQDNFNPLALVNACLDSQNRVNNENLFLFAKV